MLGEVVSAWTGNPYLVLRKAFGLGFGGKTGRKGSWPQACGSPNRLGDKRLALLGKERLLEWNAQYCNFSEQIYGCTRQPSRKNNGTEV
jgi:hypothetical protein